MSNVGKNTAADAFIDGIILLDKNVSDHTLDSDFLFKGGYKCLKKAMTYARETVDKIAKKSVLPVNPLIFAGEVDSCKNHLLHAIWNSLVKERLGRGEPEPVVAYMQIASDYDPMNAIYAGFSDKEKKEVFVKIVERIKRTDALFVDEIQYFEGKPETMGLMVEVSKIMKLMNKPMIMTSQKTDIDRTGLIPELAERFGNFEYIRISPPDAEDRLKMLEDFLRDENLSLGSPKLKELWQRNTERCSLRRLVNKLNRLASEAKEGSITAEVMEHVFEEMDSAKRKDSAKKILEAICARFKVDLKMLISEERKFAYERTIAIYFIKNANMGMNFCEVGKKLGRSEDTARIAYDKIERIMGGDTEWFNRRKPSQIKADIEEIKKALKAQPN